MSRWFWNSLVGFIMLFAAEPEWGTHLITPSLFFVFVVVLFLPVKVELSLLFFVSISIFILFADVMHPMNVFPKKNDFRKLRKLKIPDGVSIDNQPSIRVFEKNPDHEFTYQNAIFVEDHYETPALMNHLHQRYTSTSATLSDSSPFMCG